MTSHLEGRKGDQGADECSHNPPSANDQRHEDENGQGDPVRNRSGDSSIPDDWYGQGFQDSKPMKAPRATVKPMRTFVRTVDRTHSCSRRYLRFKFNGSNY